jgi:hypothetical protein
MRTQDGRVPGRFRGLGEGEDYPDGTAEHPLGRDYDAALLSLQEPARTLLVSPRSGMIGRAGLAPASLCVATFRAASRLPGQSARLGALARGSRPTMATHGGRHA